ncbi:hypothetical protein PHLGIDRAFT_129939 [Phlebiopsis gigantea 11061_1 CR5-6]|uniref:DUF6534 domain-containing protein n=1 Tax=Phlebiopsis gigantea (strain 11061_1 CR5-6) TaxID=745531 RepID=A0A0C3PEB8_PHLG1|nr:hypothetical protein PHLGIDRAFT_129939 [Phlebiopsis gigantea 11061_1 CR5-6]
MDSPQALVEAAQHLLSPLLVLMCLTLVFYGMFTTQVYSYWLRYDKDTNLLRGFVLTLWALETVHTGFCIHILYWTFIDNLGNPGNTFTIGWSTGTSIVFEVIIPALVQGFYIYRIWALSSNLIMVTVPAVMLLARIGVGLTTTSFLFKFQNWGEFADTRYVKITMNIGLVLASCVDITITSLLIHLFRKHQSLTTFRRTRRLVQHLMIYTVNTGAITMVCGVAALLMYDFVTGSLLFGGMLQILSELYANSLLGMLNARDYLKGEHLSNGAINSIPLQIRTPPSTANGTTREGHLLERGIHINIQKDVSKDKDWSQHSESEPDKHGLP